MIFHLFNVAIQQKVLLQLQNKYLKSYYVHEINIKIKWFHLFHIKDEIIPY